MKTFKQYLEENFLASLAATAGLLTGGAMAAPQANSTPSSQTTTSTAKYHPETHDFIKSAEGFKSSSYEDNGQYSVGYGTGMHIDGTRVAKGDTVSKQQAHDMMVHHINTRIIPKASSTAVWGNMNDRQKGAFVSFLYNVGEHTIGSSKHPNFNAALRSGNVNAVFDHMETYNKVTKTDENGNKIKVVSPGLVNRRQAERDFAYGGTTPSTNKTGNVNTAPVDTPAVSTDSNQHHEVVPGDTLSSISRRYGTTVPNLLKNNPDIKNPDSIKPGQRIKYK